MWYHLAIQGSFFTLPLGEQLAAIPADLLTQGAIAGSALSVLTILNSQGMLVLCPELGMKCVCLAGGGYSLFAGREVSRALAKMSLKKEDCTADLSDCTEKELASLAEWEAKFKDKYAVVGQVRASVHVPPSWGI